jgi:hypothetical protein
MTVVATNAASIPRAARNVLTLTAAGATKSMVYRQWECANKTADAQQRTTST